MADWTEIDIALLKQHHADGLSAVESGSILGRNRNAILGKRFRLGLADPRPPAKIVAKPKPKRGKVGRPPNQPTMSKKVLRRDAQNHLVMVDLRVEKEDAFKPFKVRHPSLMQLRSHHCRWPLDDPRRGVVYCGNWKAGHPSYCGFHGRLSCQPC